MPSGHIERLGQQLSALLGLWHYLPMVGGELTRQRRRATTSSRSRGTSRVAKLGSRSGCGTGNRVGYAISLAIMNLLWGGKSARERERDQGGAAVGRPCATVLLPNAAFPSVCPEVDDPQGTWCFGGDRKPCRSVARSRLALTGASSVPHARWRERGGGKRCGGGGKLMVGAPKPAQHPLQKAPL